jgi:hypothetical protein
MVVIESRNLVEVQKVRQVYGKSGGPDLLVLDDVDLTLKEKSSGCSADPAPANRRCSGPLPAS